MKKFTWLLSAALPVVLFFSCQKEVAPSNARNPALKTVNNCSVCVPEWEDSRETVVSDVDNNYYVDVSNDATKIYITIYRTGDGKFTKAKNILVKQGADIIYNVAGPIGGGSTSTLSLPAIIFNQPLVACAPISISLETVGVGQGGGKVLSNVMYYLRKKCVIETCDLAGYSTYTRGYWTNNNGTQLLAQNWAAAQPSTIGCETGLSHQFVTQAEASAFIADNTGTPGVLPNGGTFAAQVLTLTFNVNLDKNLASFGSGKLACAIVDVDPSDPLAIWNGYSVATILDIANDVLGGCASNYTPSQMTAIIDAINKNFDNGTVDLGVLTCGVCP